MSRVHTPGNIDITFYVNPNLFWFKFKEESLLTTEKLKKLDNKIQCYAKRVNEKRIFDYSPSTGEIVIVRHCSGSVDKWIRARVDHEFEYGRGTEYILWIIDYGFPLRSSSRFIRKLESLDLQIEEVKSIFKGGMIGVPASLEFNISTYKNELVKLKMWSGQAVNATEEILFNAETVTFYPKINLNNHLFGEVVIESHSGHSTKLSDLLHKTNASMDMNTHNFVEEYQSLIQNPYWEENKHQKFFKIPKNYPSLYVNENLHASTSTNYNLIQKISDWERRNISYKNNSSINTSADNDSVESIFVSTINNKFLESSKVFHSPTSQREKDSINEMKKLDISDLPMNKRYDFITQTENDNNEMRHERYDYVIDTDNDQMIKKKLERINRMEQKINGKMYPAGYRA